MWLRLKTTQGRDIWKIITENNFGCNQTSIVSKNQISTFLSKKN